MHQTRVGLVHRIQTNYIRDAWPDALRKRLVIQWFPQNANHSPESWSLFSTKEPEDAQRRQDYVAKHTAVLLLFCKWFNCVINHKRENDRKNKKQCTDLHCGCDVSPWSLPTPASLPCQTTQARLLHGTSCNDQGAHLACVLSVRCGAKKHTGCQGGEKRRRAGTKCVGRVRGGGLKRQELALLWVHKGSPFTASQVLCWGLTVQSIVHAFSAITWSSWTHFCSHSLNRLNPPVRTSNASLLWMGDDASSLMHIHSHPHNST